MKDLGSYRVPREAEVGREVRMEQRRNANRTALLAIGGIAALCVCLGIALTVLWIGYNQLNGSGSSVFNLPVSNATPTRSTASRTPTAVPYSKAGTSDNGLRVTVTAYQRPLPTEDINIPDGQELVLVTVRIENTRTTGAPLKFSPDDFALVSPEGDHFAPTVGGITTGENLQAGQVSPGKSTKGDLIFYIYSDVSDLQLAWTAADGKTRLFRLTR